jgi:hypothetical protein
LLAVCQVRAGEFVAFLTPAQEVPPVSANSAGFFYGLAAAPADEPHNRITYFWMTAGTVNAVAAHLHLAPAGQEGPIVAPLNVINLAPLDLFSLEFGFGVLTENDVEGPLTSIEDIVQAMVAGNIYVNVHTEAYLDGEVRGQVFGPLGGAPPTAAPAPSQSTRSGAPAAPGTTTQRRR